MLASPLFHLLILFCGLFENPHQCVPCFLRNIPFIRDCLGELWSVPCSERSLSVCGHWGWSFLWGIGTLANSVSRLTTAKAHSQLWTFSSKMSSLTTSMTGVLITWRCVWGNSIHHHHSWCIIREAFKLLGLAFCFQCTLKCS